MPMLPARQLSDDYATLPPMPLSIADD